MNWEAEGGINSRLFVLSQDADVGECFLRIFSWNGDQYKDALWKLHTNFSCLNFPAYEEFQLRTVDRLKARHITDDTQKTERLKNLVDVTIKFLTPSSQQDLLTALNEFQFFGVLPRCGDE